MCILQCTYLKEALRTLLLGYRRKYDFKYVFILSCLHMKSIQYSFQSIFRITLIVPFFFFKMRFWGWGNRGSHSVRCLFFTFSLHSQFASSMTKEMNSDRKNIPTAQHTKISIVSFLCIILEITTQSRLNYWLSQTYRGKLLF